MQVASSNNLSGFFSRIGWFKSSSVAAESQPCGTSPAVIPGVRRDEHAAELSPDLLLPPLAPRVRTLSASASSKLSFTSVSSSTAGGEASPGAAAAGVADQDNAASPVVLLHKLSVACCSEKGLRKAMEDRWRMAELSGHACLAHCARANYFAVFDGHSGPEVAEYLSEHMLGYVLANLQQGDAPLVALRHALLRCEAECLAMLHTPGGMSMGIGAGSDCSTSGSGGEAGGITGFAHAGSCSAGSTALAALVVDDRLFIANVGDCRAMVGRGAKAVQLTEDHKASHPAEEQRLRLSGVEVTEDGYIFGELAVARAIGNRHIKLDPLRQGGLICEPSLHEYKLSAEDDFLVLATDGLWEVMTNAEVVRFARRALAEQRDAQNCANKLVADALRLGSADNISVLVACLHDRPISLTRGNSKLFRGCNSSTGSPRQFDSPRSDILGTPTPPST